jgi:hypothetical protein
LRGAQNKFLESGTYVGPLAFAAAKPRGFAMHFKFDMAQAIGPGIRELMPPAPVTIDLQVLLLRFALKEAERLHYCGCQRDQAGASSTHQRLPRVAQAAH